MKPARRKNSQAKELTFEQAEARKERGVEGLRRLGQDEHADNLDEESVEDFAERKGLTILNPRQGPRNRPARRKRNSGEGGEQKGAEEMFAKFHGRRPTTVQDIEIRQQDRRNLAGLGQLMYLQTKHGIPMKFSEHDKVIVACDPEGNQIYFVGGNQDLSDILEQAQINCQKDLIDVGECQYIIYTADKDFDNFQELDYQHEFGEEDVKKGEKARRPRLMFDRQNRQMYLVGGAYEVKREGIVN